MLLSTESISKLRARTGVSILACKQALEEAKGDEEKAIEILRKQGIAQAAKKAARAQSQGCVFTVISERKAALVLLLCETDFVARDSNFQEVGNGIAREAFAKGPNAAKVLAEKSIPELVAKLGENISVAECHLIEAPVVGVYVHGNGKIGVAIGLEEGSKDLARDAAMHAAAMNPLYAHPEEVSSEAIAKEREIWAAQLAKEGKPPAIQEKIMMGKEKKFREENALTTQPFVKDPSKTVGQYLGTAKVVQYVRVAVS